MLFFFRQKINIYGMLFLIRAENKLHVVRDLNNVTLATFTQPQNYIRCLHIYEDS